MTNQIKTVLLMGTLTVLVVGFGALVAPGQLYLFAAIAIAVNLGAYFFPLQPSLPTGLKADIVPGTQPATVQGETFSVSTSLVVTDQRSRTATITGTDVLASNGVIHVIDRVILPAP